MILSINFKFEPIYLIYPVILFGIFIGVRLFLNTIKKKTTLELQDLLYRKRQLFLYLELLNNKRLRIAFSKAELKLLKLEGLLALGSDEEVENIINELDNTKLKKRYKLDFLNKRFTYFVEKNNKKEAKKTYEDLHHLLEKNKHAEAKKILKEAKRILDIYINRDTSLINTLLVEAKETENQVVKGITYYRVAKLYYFLKDNKKAKEYLQEAKPLVVGTYYEGIISEALKDIKILEVK